MPKAKALIRLRGCADCVAPVLFANLRRQFFSRQGPLKEQLENVHKACLAIVLSKKTTLKGTGQIAQMCRVVCTIVVCKPQKSDFPVMFIIRPRRKTTCL